MSRHLTMCSWDQVPHLTKEAKDQLFAALPPYQRDARMKGIPQLGSGAIYPVPESDFVVKPFDIPKYWPRAYALDVGWRWTACVWAARDLESDIVYFYSDYLRAEGGPDIHASAIKGRGPWMAGVIDPAANGRSQLDGQDLLQVYKRLGLEIYPADNGVEAGIYEVWVRLTSGRLKVFASCNAWLEEFRLYRRDMKGKVVKTKDHLQDAGRYLIFSGIDHMRVKPGPKVLPVSRDSSNTDDRGWMT